MLGNGKRPLSFRMSQGMSLRVTHDDTGSKLSILQADGSSTMTLFVHRKRGDDGLAKFLVSAGLEMQAHDLEMDMREPALFGRLFAGLGEITGDSDTYSQADKRLLRELFRLREWEGLMIQALALPEFRTRDEEVRGTEFITQVLTEAKAFYQKEI